MPVMAAYSSSLNAQFVVLTMLLCNISKQVKKQLDAYRNTNVALLTKAQR